MGEVDPNKEHRKMCKLVDKIEKRQTKIDLTRNKIKERKNALKQQQIKMIQRLQFDRDQIHEAFNLMQQQIANNYMALNAQYNQDLDVLKVKESELKQIHDKTVGSMWDKNVSIKKMKKETMKIVNEFDEDFKKIKTRKPCLEYISYLAKRHAMYQDIMEGVKPLNEEEEKEEKRENVWLGVEGYLVGVVPICPDRVDVSLT